MVYFGSEKECNILPLKSSIKISSVTELGSMNVFIHWINDKGKKEIVTCPLNGTVLPGITRNTVIGLLREMKYDVIEIEYTIKSVL